MGRHQIIVHKEKIARSFRRGMETYDREAIVQRTVNERLIAILESLGHNDDKRILEVGCCTGMLSELLCSRFQPENYFLNDLVSEFLTPVSERLGETAASCLNPFFGDIEDLALPKNLELIISSSAFQWLSDLEYFFNNIPAALTGKGVLVFSMFGDGTFHELQELIGVGLEYHSFQSVMDMVDKNLNVHYCGIKRDTLFFDNASDVLRHIQATGVGGVGGFKWTPRKLQKFSEDYQERFGVEQGVPLSYVSYYFAGGKRD